MNNNEYINKLNAIKLQEAHMLKEIGDQWETPIYLYWGMHVKYGPFSLDLFAEEGNAKCRHYFTAEDNALTKNWFEKLTEIKGEAAFANPPYSRPNKHEGQDITGMISIMEYANKMREKGGRYVFLVKAAPSEKWWPEDADHIAFIKGRIGFSTPSWFKPADKNQKPGGSGFGAAIIIFDKKFIGDKISYIEKSHLVGLGEGYIESVERELQKRIEELNEIRATVSA